jgi:hypothetical protein
MGTDHLRAFTGRVRPSLPAMSGRGNDPMMLMATAIFARFERRRSPSVFTSDCGATNSVIGQNDRVLSELGHPQRGIRSVALFASLFTQVFMGWWLYFLAHLLIVEFPQDHIEPLLTGRIVRLVEPPLGHREKGGTGAYVGGGLRE